METTMPVARKRVGRGRPRIHKVAADNEVDAMQSPGTSDADMTIDSLNSVDGIPIPKMEVDPTAASNVTISECRRSSRKKCIKFDVREVLNKNRKPHKIQIEARIDSNAPKNIKNLAVTSIGCEELNSAACLTMTATSSDLASKQKTFIEKQAIFRRFSISDQQHKGLLIESFTETSEGAALPHLSRAKDVFSASMQKSKQNCSLIVAQMESPTKSVPDPLSKRRGAPKVQKLPPSLTKASAISEGAMQPRRRGRPPKNKSLMVESNANLCSQAVSFNSSTVDDSIYSDLSSLDVTQSSPCVESFNLEIDTMPPQKLQDQNDIVLEISSSSSAGTTSTKFDASKRMNEAKARSFASVSFLQEGMGLNNDQCTEPEFIVAAVEEIICDTEVSETNQVEVDEPKTTAQSEKEHNIPFRSTSGSESDAHSDCCSKSYKEGAELRVAVKRLFMPNIKLQGKASSTSCEVKKYQTTRSGEEEIPNAPAAVAEDPQSSKNLSKPQEINEAYYAKAMDCAFESVGSRDNSTASFVVSQVARNQSNLEPDIEALLQKSVIVNKNVQKTEQDHENVVEVDSQCSNVSPSKNKNFILPLKKQVKKFENFNVASMEEVREDALPESSTLPEQETTLAFEKHTDVTVVDALPVPESLHGTDPTWQTASTYSDLPIDKVAIPECEQLIESEVGIAIEDRYDDYIEEIDVYNEASQEEHSDVPADGYDDVLGSQYVAENYEVNDADVVQVAPDCVQEEIVLASDQFQKVVCDAETSEEQSTVEDSSHHRLDDERIQEEAPQKSIESDDVGYHISENIEGETPTAKSEGIPQKMQDNVAPESHSTDLDVAVAFTEQSLPTHVEDSIELPSESIEEQRNETLESSQHKDSLNDVPIPKDERKDLEDVPEELVASTSLAEKVEVQVKTPGRRGRKPKKKVPEVEDSKSEIQEKAEITDTNKPKKTVEGEQIPYACLSDSSCLGDVIKTDEVKSEEMPLKVKTSGALLTEDERPTSAVSSEMEKTDTVNDSKQQSEYELTTREQVLLIGNIHQYVGEEEIIRNNMETTKEEKIDSSQSNEDHNTARSQLALKVEPSKNPRRGTESDDSASQEKDSKKNRPKKSKKSSSSPTTATCPKLEEAEEKDDTNTKKESNELLQHGGDREVALENKVKVEPEICSEVESAPIDCSLIPLPDSEKPKKARSASDEVNDPLKDIAEFIEYGVSLLKRDYKADEEGNNSQQQIDGEQPKPVEATISTIPPPLPCKEEPQSATNSTVDSESSQNDLKSTDLQQNDLRPTDLQQNDLQQNDLQPTELQPTDLKLNDESDSKSVIPFFETPADTPTITPTVTPPKSPIDDEQLYEEFTGVRRSHRIKKIHKNPRALVGRGVVESKANYNMDVHLTDLAEVEAKNAQFLKEMEERLSNFQVIKENEYRCERVVSKEARKMLCDCFLTSEEEERGEMGCGEDCLNRLLMIECGQNCNVKDRCTNKRFQKFLYSPCRVFRTEKKGFGIMAESEVMPGEFIMEYVGEVIDGKEFEKRRNLYSIDKNRHYYFMALRSDTIIDATTKGNISRFINHSCDPNAETQKWTVNGELRIGFFSRKAIMPGEEITFDYQYQRYGREAQRCYCESSNCRGWIGEEPNSEEGEQLEDDSEDDNLAEKLLNADDDDSDEDVDEEEAKRKLEMAAAEANLSDDEGTVGGAGEKSKLEEDPNTMFKKLLAKIAEKMAEKKKKNKEEKRRRRRGKSPNVSPTKSRYMEDPDIDEDIDYLSHYGLKNQSDTLRFSRVMVRAETAQTRQDLLEVLRKAELPCRRLFLDYHGLRLLHGWMCKDTNDLDLRMAYLETLENLPITNRTILTDSKVYQIVRTWCGTATSQESGSPSDDSSKESSSNSQKDEKTEDSEKTDLQKMATKLMTTWDNLPDNYRIPKRERIEQMKEHEREADRQYEAGLDEESQTIGSEGYQRDRFGRDMSSRYHKRVVRDGRTISVMGGGLPTDPRKYLSKEQRRQMFAAQVAYDERVAFERRAYRDHCLYFGLDPETTRPQDMPFMTNPQTGEWWSASDQLIATPPKFVNDPIPAKVQSTDPEDYELPPSLAELPPNWKFAITSQGHVYYYHLEKRVPQWEPPTPEQVSKAEEEGSGSEINEDEYSTEDEDEVLIGMDEEKFKAYVENRVKSRKQQRANNLVEERPISPRRDEDRIYNQIEMRKYKENKEKIRKRKEEIRRRRAEALKKKAQACKNPQENEESGAVAEEGAESKAKEATADEHNEPADALPIQDYLLSSDEDDFAADCKDSALLDKIVEGDKIVDELDALTTKRALKRSLPTGASRDTVSEQVPASEVVIEGASTEKDRHESSKKRKLEKREKREKRMKDAEMKNRKIKDKFRFDIAGIILQHLKPYRKESCQMGRITNEDDFNHLIRKLTHFVMLKEMKYCASVGQTLIVNDSVKNKSREFIKKYMAKYDKVYVRPVSDPEFKDIPKVTS